MNKFIIDESDSNTRIDAYLANVLENISRSKIQTLIKTHSILLNNAPTKPSQQLKPDDIITYAPEIFDEIKLQPEPLTLDTVYETENYAIINKPSGMLTHPTSTEKTGTLVNALLYKYKNLSNLNGNLRPGIIHRLDRNTSGLLIIAKTNPAHEILAKMIKDREIEKHYRAIVKGIISENLTINEPIGRNKSNPAKMSVTPDGKPSLTEITILKQFHEATYLDINLKTGRTHQIRVHLSHIGHPVYNDTLYGFGKQKIKTEEQVLQSYKLSFLDPFDNKSVNIEIPPDEKITKILKYLENKEL